VASAPVSCATVTCWLPLAPGWVKVNRQVMSATDVVPVEVELELVEGRGIPRGADLRRGIHRDDRARAVVVAGPGGKM